MQLYEELVLLVDDDPVCQQILRINTESLDYRFLALGCGRDFIETVHQTRPSLVLIDVHLPDCSGFELCSALKAAPDLSHIPVLFLTIATDPDSIDEAFQRGAIDYITKPFRPEEVRSRIQAHVRLGQANRRLERELGVKRKLFSLISHDLRSPFSSMVGVLHLLVTEYDSMKDQDRIDFMRGLLENASGHLQLLDNLTYWSRGQSNRIISRPIPLSLHSLVQLVADDLRQMASAKGISVANMVPADRIVLVDSELARVVMRNLLHNSLKFAPRQSMVTIRLAEAAGGNAERRAALRFEDTGAGIERPEMLFCEHEFPSTTGTVGEKGAGIGLVIARSLAEHMGGFIELAETGPTGTAMVLFLPIPEMP
jgi:two-component system sensor histidine kinase/response regulator